MSRHDTGSEAADKGRITASRSQSDADIFLHTSRVQRGMEAMQRIAGRCQLPGYGFAALLMAAASELTH